ncbi:hypothetical protein [Streptomyces sp. TLI_185]|uniref:hypothetical protein n=1 Tax=Streptomyces sp. TLI_185 TaxID=2485151 RepID=UPI0011D001EE|nr:hypothetical protein [Streptomyces sp. TLI_185]
MSVTSDSTAESGWVGDPAGNRSDPLIRVGVGHGPAGPAELVHGCAVDVTRGRHLWRTGTRGR